MSKFSTISLFLVAVVVTTNSTALKAREGKPEYLNSLNSNVVYAPEGDLGECLNCTNHILCEHYCCWEGWECMAGAGRCFCRLLE